MLIALILAGAMPGSVGYKKIVPHVSASKPSTSKDSSWEPFSMSQMAALPSSPAEISLVPAAYTKLLVPPSCPERVCTVLPVCLSKIRIAFSAVPTASWSPDMAKVMTVSGVSTCTKAFVSYVKPCMPEEINKWPLLISAGVKWTMSTVNPGIRSGISKIPIQPR